MKFPLVMGILNVTPDSFSDGGLFLDPDRAVEHGLEMVKKGAQIIDIGGESTRPGAKEISAKEQLERVIPVIKGIKQHSDVLISVDTRSSEVAAAAIHAGAAIVNDVSGFKHDKDMVKVIAKYDVYAIAMHMRGTPQNMKQLNTYKNLLWDISAELKQSIDMAVNAGVDINKIWIDPGIGFAKDAQQSLKIMNNIPFFKKLGLPVVIGPSRKSFMAPVLNKQNPQDRVWGTAAAVAIAIYMGADCVRVHDVEEMSDVVKVAKAIKEAKVV